MQGADLCAGSEVPAPSLSNAEGCSREEWQFEHDMEIVLDLRAALTARPLEATLCVQERHAALVIINWKVLGSRRGYRRAGCFIQPSQKTRAYQRL